MDAENVNVQEVEQNAVPEGEVEVDFEAKARKEGWLPEAEWDGPQEKWVDAETFVKRGESILPILRKNYRKLESDFKNLRKELDSAVSTNKKFGEYHKNLVERLNQQHEAEVKQLKAQMRQAAAEGDTDKYDQLESQMDALQTIKPPKLEEVPQNQGKPADLAQIQQEWLDSGNDWFLKDPELHMYAFNMGEFLARTRPDLVGRAQLDEVTRMTRERFPEKFGNQRREEPGSTLGGEKYADGGPKKGKKTYENLPSDARKACDEYVAQGLLTKEQFVKDYQWE